MRSASAALILAVFVSAMIFPIILSENAAADPLDCGCECPDCIADGECDGTLCDNGCLCTHCETVAELDCGCECEDCISAGDCDGSDCDAGCECDCCRIIEFEISGCVVEGLDAVGLAGVNVYVDGALVGTTDEDGEFSFSVYLDIAEEHTIRFEKRGYVVAAYYSNGKLLTGDNLPLDIPSGTEIMIPDVLMAEAFGAIGGKVTHNGQGVRVNVQVLDIDSGDIYRRSTKEDGTFSFESVCPVGGNYEVSIIHQYYEADSIEVNDLGIVPFYCEFELTIKSETLYLFDLDLTHSFMLIGGIIGLFLLIFVILYRIHIGRNPETSKVYSDRKKDQE